MKLSRHSPLTPVIALVVATGTAAAAEPVQFGREVLPILSAKCFACHGPDEEGRQADLRLDLEAEATRARDGGAPIVPGKPDESTILARVTSTDPDVVMPPADSHKPLTPEQVEVLRRWIAAGAAWGRHWSFEPVVKPEPPAMPDGRTAASPIDAFVAARLAPHGLAIREAAPPHALIRRLALDLTGLPPTPEEADVFAADRSPAAYEALVDKLLASPAFGEHWARMWLDLARYGDTRGYEKDLPRSMWPYRDWVVESLNADMPLDRFTLEQLAGDLLPEPTERQLVATAFHRNTLANDEAGTDDEEFRVAAVKDRIDTTVQAWMGLTMGCAKCHTHKYDPISHHDYYSFYAIFDQTADADRADEEPKLELRFEDEVVRLPVMKELAAAERRTTRIHNRGNFLDPGETVQPAVLSAFGSLPEDAAPDRIGVARWLVSADNPLTPRVWANRVWARIFGLGIVETEEDFGALGSAPTHPELLDWLAAEYRDGGWSLKKLAKTIVMSDTYRQRSDVTPALAAADPRNQWLSRGARFRLPAETIRDQALAVSGLLSTKRGGPPVMPPQPAGLWRSTYNTRKWVDAEGEDRHRRGLYTFLKRTTPYPSFVTFDAGSGEICQVRRIRTNTPLQALVTLNDPVYLEAAGGLAGRMTADPADDPAAVVNRGLRLALVRSPHDGEADPLVRLMGDARDRFAADPEAAAALLTAARVTVPEGADRPTLAAAVVAASGILNLDELLTRN